MCQPSRLAADRGQVMPLLVVLLVAMLGIGVVAIRHAELLDDRARAQTAADAAALAGAAEGEAAARRLARSNGGEIAVYDRWGRTVVVEVRVGRAAARATAQSTVRWVGRG